MKDAPKAGTVPRATAKAAVAKAKRERTERERLVDELWVILRLCQMDGTPCDGPRFREAVRNVYGIAGYDLDDFRAALLTERTGTDELTLRAENAEAALAAVREAIDGYPATERTGERERIAKAYRTGYVGAVVARGEPDYRVTPYVRRASYEYADAELATPEPERHPDPFARCEAVHYRRSMRCLRTLGHEGQHVAGSGEGEVRWPERGGETLLPTEVHGHLIVAVGTWKARCLECKREGPDEAAWWKQFECELPEPGALDRLLAAEPERGEGATILDEKTLAEHDARSAEAAIQSAEHLAFRIRACLRGDADPHSVNAFAALDELWGRAASPEPAEDKRAEIGDLDTYDEGFRHGMEVGRTKSQERTMLVIASYAEEEISTGKLAEALGLPHDDEGVQRLRAAIQGPADPMLGVGDG